MKTLSVIMPSRAQPMQAAFLTRAIRSVADQQSVQSDLQVEVIVGLDPHTAVPRLEALGVPVRFETAGTASQASALNVAAASAGGEFLAILEDDDIWQPYRLTPAMQALGSCDFVSCTQLEVDVSGSIIRINDCATPSGWLMPREIWHQVGPFDEQYLYHLDNEWLGRLDASGGRRLHLVEATAPTSLEVARQVRPWLANVLALGGSQVQLARHRWMAPLVTRMVHAGSGMARVMSDPAAAQISASECGRLKERFGRIPW
jgi:glycosyltransferase involved in cell wall biosynthesis